MSMVLEIFQGIVGKQVGGLVPKELGILGWKWQVTYDPTQLSLGFTSNESVSGEALTH